VPKTSTTVNITWADLGISSAAHVLGLSATFVNGTSPTTVDLVVTRLGLL
jgi:hypothetical protein